MSTKCQDLRVLIYEQPWRDLTNMKKSNKHASATFSNYLSECPDLFFSVLDKLLEPIDHIRCALVCKEWQSLAKEYNLATQRWSRVPPMLMVSTGSSTALFSIFEEKSYIRNFQLTYKHEEFCVSSHGWLAMVDGIGSGITLMNPFAQTMTPISLPHLNDNISKVILSADPVRNPKSCMVIAIYNSGDLAFLRGGQDDWILIRLKHRLTDAIFYKRKLYAVSDRGVILSINVNRLHPAANLRVQAFMPHIRKLIDTYEAHIVESTKGDLWHVRRCNVEETQSDGTVIWRETFKVYKVVFSDTDGSMVKHVEVKTIEDETLFLRKNYSLSVPASKLLGCQPNSIYYTGDSTKHVMRIFDIELGITSAVYYPNTSSHSQIPPGLWITPPFKGLC